MTKAQKWKAISSLIYESNWMNRQFERQNSSWLLFEMALWNCLNSQVLNVCFHYIMILPKLSSPFFKHKLIIQITINLTIKNFLILDFLLFIYIKLNDQFSDRYKNLAMVLNFTNFLKLIQIFYFDLFKNLNYVVLVHVLERKILNIKTQK